MIIKSDNIDFFVEHGRYDRLCINDPRVTGIEKFPTTVEVIAIENAKITNLPRIPEGVISLHIRNTPLVELPNIPKSL